MSVPTATSTGRPASSIADILAFDQAGLLGAVKDLGEPAYRAKQVFAWIYEKSAGSFDEMTNLSKDLRAKLADVYTYALPELVERQDSRDGTRKYLWRFADGVMVESVGLPAGKRLTVCFSTQAGCRMGCTFCATGEGGLTRNLLPGEIALQVALVAADFGMRASNAVAMGQGEPFANYDATLGALRIMNSPDGLGIGARHLTVSTCGLVSGIERFSREPEQFTLAVSLHSAIQATRDELMPAVRSSNLKRLRKAIVGYADATGRRPSLEYALIQGVNDSVAERRALIDFCRGMLCHVNLIPANRLESLGVERSEKDTVHFFLEDLTAAGIEATVRSERGADIDAACGQLRQRVEDQPGTG